ncbi:MAG: hypothetical protein V4760_01295 [Bdellovibrionota bacterium]
MKNVIAILAFIMASQANAQTYVSAQPVQTLPAAQAQARPTVLYDERTNQLVEVAPQVEQAPQPISQPVYVINSNSQRNQGYQSAQIQEQPTTIVQEAPLKNSAADQMRRQRQDSEAGTEDGIVQALEKARMDDELKRRERFTGALTATPTPAPAPIVQQQVAPVIVAAPVQEEEQPVRARKIKDLDEEPTEKVDIKSEIRAALAEKEAAPAPAKQVNYVSGLIGMGAYPDVVNVRGNGAVGVAVGLVTPDRVVAEGSFLYGNYDLEDVFNYGYYPRIVAMKQYNMSAAVKYQLLPGKIRPNVGGAASYTRRSFSEYKNDFLTSDALDVALSTGLDIAISDAFSVGMDLRYYWNVAYKSNSNQPQSFVYNRGRNPIEELQYYTATVAAKFTF